MTERNGTTSNVDLFSRETKHLLRSDNDDRERLVELPQSDVVFRDTGVLESKGDGEGRGRGEVDGFGRGVGVSYSLV